MQLAAYIRMSTERQEDSPETQLKIIKEYCKQNGHTIVRVYQDLAKSGGSMEGRAELRELLRDAEQKVFEGVVIYKLDRAFRNLGEQLVTLKKLKSLEVKLVAVADPLSEGAAGGLIVNILGSVNQFERELTGERIYHHNRELAKKGKWTGGSRPPLGYRYDKEIKKIEVVPEEAEIIRQIASTFLKTKGTSTTAWEMNSMGYKTRDGLSWSPQLIHNVLTNPFYIGRVRYGYRKTFISESGKKYCKRSKEYESFPGEHEPLISEDDFNVIQDVFSRKDTFKKKSNRVYVFTGIFKCSMCGGPVTGAFHSHISKKGYRCLHHIERKDSCKGFQKLEYIIENAIQIELIKNIELVKVLEKSSEVSTKKTTKSDNGKRIKKMEQKLLRQQEMYEEGIDDKETFYRKRKITLSELEKLKNESILQDNGRDDSHAFQLLKSFQENWDHRWEAPIAYRDLIHSLIKEIYSDGKTLDIFFYPFNRLPGWRERVMVDL